LLIYHLSFIIYHSDTKMKKDNVTYDKAFKFAIRIVKAFQYLSDSKREFILSKQMLRSGTSIGANIAEANGAISDADFSSKISIAYKEGLETKYCISLLKETGYINEKLLKASSMMQTNRKKFSLRFSKLRELINDE